MDIEAFPEIESFQKLPRQVIVKGGGFTLEGSKGNELRGLVINNIGHPVKDIRIHLVVFDSRKIPQISTSVAANPDRLDQGGIANFLFQLKDYPTAIKDYHLYAGWKFDER